LKLKEENEQEFNRWWESQSEQERFQLFYEDRFREPRIFFANQQASGGDIVSPRTAEPGSLEITLTGPDL
jgi:hypothetical protein